MRDKYQKAVEYLTKNPEKIYDVWNNPHLSPQAGCLFQYVTPNGDSLYDKNYCGCLTLVKCGLYKACTEELTEMIRDDDRIPETEDDITVESLPVFAEWQARIDKILNRGNNSIL